MQLITETEKLYLILDNSPVFLVSEQERFACKIDDSTIFYRRMTVEKQAEFERNYGGRDGNQRGMLDAIMLQCILSWEDVPDSHGNMLAYEASLVQGIPDEARLILVDRFYAACPIEVALAKERSTITYRRVPNHIRHSFERRYTTRGVTDWHAVADQCFRYAILEWSGFYDYEVSEIPGDFGAEVKYEPALIMRLPHTVRGELADALGGLGNLTQAKTNGQVEMENLRDFSTAMQPSPTPMATS